MDNEELLKQEFGRFKTAFATTQVLKEVVAELISKIEDRPVAGVKDDLELRIKDKFRITYHQDPPV